MITMFGHCSHVSEYKDAYGGYNRRRVAHCTINGHDTTYDGSIIVEAEERLIASANIRQGWTGTITAIPEVRHYNDREYMVIRLVSAIELTTIK